MNTREINSFKVLTCTSLRVCVLAGLYTCTCVYMLVCVYVGSEGDIPSYMYYIYICTMCTCIYIYIHSTKYSHPAIILHKSI